MTPFFTQGNILRKGGRFIGCHFYRGANIYKAKFNGANFSRTIFKRRRISRVYLFYEFTFLQCEIS